MILFLFGVIAFDCCFVYFIVIKLNLVLLLLVVILLFHCGETELDIIAFSHLLSHFD